MLEVMLPPNMTWTQGKDPVVDSWITMGSPLPVLSMSVIYLIVVVWLGPYLMSKRKPFDLKSTIIVYNIYQILFTGYSISMPFWRANVANSILSYCNKSEAKHLFDEDVLFITWGYYFAKIIDLFDTVIFVLRKKQRQISFLHVSHHVIILLTSWFILKFLQESPVTIIFLLNHGVHFFMYQYYLLAALVSRPSSLLWIKKKLTTLQMVQCGLVISYVITLWAKGCYITPEFVVFTVVMMSSLLVLFVRFYIKTYISKLKKKT